MRVLLLATVALAAMTAAPLAAQSGAAAMPGMNMDPTNKIVGSGKLPGDWMMRFDPARPPSGRGGAPPPVTPAPAPAMTDVDVQTMGTGMHFRTGPAAIYWSPKNVAT